ncbi:MAG TPA: tetratricopeptide repeat protein, partial [Ferruginibacter sp.]|nr:tetratricopeptide repeat protein [Ferruginibacter sp.]
KYPQPAMIRLSFFFLLSLLLPNCLLAQKQKADSLMNLLNAEKQDTNRVKLMWRLASVMSVYSPDTALVYAQKSLNLATEIKYSDGQSKAMGVLASSFRKLGNYSRALEYNFRKLQLAEKETNPDDLATVLMNIGIIYRYQEEYPNALLYYYKADSVIQQYKLEDSRYYILMNLGDVYDRMNKPDSAFDYFNKSLIVSTSLKNEDFIGNSMTGLGHTYLKMGNYDFAKLNYYSAIGHLRTSNNDEVLCEAYLGLANLFKKTGGSMDSAIFYAHRSLDLAETDGFLNWQLDATRFLTEIYKENKNIDSAFVYLSKGQQLNDSVNSKEKIRKIQLLSSNEDLRQLEIAERNRIAAKERKQQLQYLFIGIFIPGFFLLTLLLSRIRIHPRIIKVLGILSLLILFEYLLLLLHPTVAELTHHTPVLEMLIFVSIAAILIPAHHRIEGWLIKKLIHRNESIRFRKVKFVSKKPKQ